jgi:hypothetical protein
MYLWRILSKLTICSFSIKIKQNMLSRIQKSFALYIYTSRGTRRCPGWPMAKSDSNFVYYITKKEGRNKLWKCMRVQYAPCYVRKGPLLTQKHTRARRRRQYRECIQRLLLQLIGKAKTCNEIGMLPSVWNVTEVLCFPFRSRDVNVCRVSDSRACNI